LLRGFFESYFTKSNGRIDVRVNRALMTDMNIADEKLTDAQVKLRVLDLFLEEISKVYSK